MTATSTARGTCPTCGSSTRTLRRDGTDRVAVVPDAVTLDYVTALLRTLKEQEPGSDASLTDRDLHQKALSSAACNLLGYFAADGRL